MYNKNSSQIGQSLLELIVVIAVGVIVLTALTFASISALRNAQVAKIQAQATKYAQEGIEKVRVLRDRNPNQAVNNSQFVVAWDDNVAKPFDCPTPCNFKLQSWSNSVGYRLYPITSAASAETSSDGLGLPTSLKRYITVQNVYNSSNVLVPTEKRFTSRVTWTDHSGDHESTLVTVLRRP